MLNLGEREKERVRRKWVQLGLGSWGIEEENEEGVGEKFGAKTNTRATTGGKKQT